MKNEVWKPLPGYVGYYEVSNMGRVKSVPKYVPYKKGLYRLTKERIMKTVTRKSGHLEVDLHKDGQRHVYRVHTLVMLAFVGERPENMEIRHLNSIPADNRLENLCYGTRSENMRDCVRVGHCNWQKLSADNVLKIRDLINSGERTDSIASKFNVYPSTIRRIKNKKCYGWL